MDNTAMIFEQYVKDLKLTASENYVYVAKDDFFGDIIFSINSTSLNMINCGALADKYFNKMISVNYIKQKTIGFETRFGILDSRDFTIQYDCREQYRKAMGILESFKNDIKSSDVINQIYALQGNDDFYNNVLLRKADEGAGRFIFGDKMMYIAPCMLPGSKSTPLDAIGYYRTGNDYYVASFTTHKPTNDVITLIKFICL